MYWIAILVFSVGVMVPEIVRNDRGTLREDEIEVIALLVLNGVLFFLFLWKDRALRALDINQRRTIQEAHDSIKDLSKAYGHIGEMNRKIDVTAQCINNISKVKKNEEICHEMKESIEIITKCKDCFIYIFDSQTRELLINSKNAPSIKEYSVQKMFTQECSNKIDLLSGTHIIFAAQRSDSMPHVYVLCHERGYQTVNEHSLLSIILITGAEVIKNRKK